MKKSFFILISILMISCSSEKEDNKNVFITISDTTSSISKEIDSKPFSNPALIYGSDFGNYFQTLYELGDFETMIKFTHSSSIEEHGKERILHKYKTMDFGFTMDLKSMNSINGKMFIMNYNSNSFATKHVTRIIVGLENDSCKVILPHDLKDFLKSISI